jgi:NitT/TauT family transport system substrate-binding protein
MFDRTISRRTFAGGLTAASLLASSNQLAFGQGTPAASPEGPIEPVTIPSFEVPEDAIEVNIGSLPVMIYAPMFVAYEKGYFAERGLDVKISPINSGTDLTVLTSTNDLQISISGVGPAFWNAIDANLPLKIIAPGHEEGDPVTTPLMVSQKSIDDGSITSVADLAGKKVSVNAPGATEYWLDAALRTDGLTIENVDLQYLTFPDAITALDSGALDGAMIGEPLATQAQQQGIAAILSDDFDVQGFQVTAVYANANWIAENHDATAGFVAAYLQACRDLMDAPNDPLNLTIINKYTDVPIDLIAQSVRPVYQAEGEIQQENLVTLQEFFAARGLLEFDGTIDPASVIEQSIIDDAVALLDAE